VKIFVGSSNPPLAEAICSAIGIEPGKISITAFPDGETLAKIEEKVRDRFKHLTSYPPSGLIIYSKNHRFGILSLRKQPRTQPCPPRSS
jgi:hypothetical protein